MRQSKTKSHDQQHLATFPYIFFFCQTQYAITGSRKGHGQIAKVGRCNLSHNNTATLKTNALQLVSESN